MQKELAWQSKLVLLLVLPFAGVGVLLETRFWVTWQPAVVIWTLGLSALLGLVTWRLRAATPAAAAAGAAGTHCAGAPAVVGPCRGRGQTLFGRHLAGGCTRVLCA